MGSLPISYSFQTTQGHDGGGARLTGGDAVVGGDGSDQMEV